MNGILFRLPGRKAAKSDAVAIRINSNIERMSANEEEGKRLYFNNCMVCHASFNVDDGAQFTFMGLEDRWPEKKRAVHIHKEFK